MNFYKDHAATFLKLKFIVFLTKKSQTSASKMWERSCWGFLWNTWKISLRLHKYGFILLNSLRIAANTVFCNPKTANYWKRSKKGFPTKHLCKYSTLLHNYTQMVGTSNQILKSYPAHRRRNFHFIFIGSEVTVQKRLRLPITWWPIASCHLTQRNKCDDFGFLVLRAFQRYVARMIL